ncbi:cornifelin isoform X2 [Petromyzon marinus]|uniref:Cornifelin homolog A-like isoform X2 n=1 Tax=Petromyzon marinus TaxID=7757 RepID=A0AAJ7UD88_PETMA|nr:cornifelin homolog A-like isoform X2 [Petromyzon marinus]XP_032833113.1 cornifelin homolog A-like isoform X2 [Petromyzon marinus]
MAITVSIEQHQVARCTPFEEVPYRNQDARLLNSASLLLPASQPNVHVAVMSQSFVVTQQPGVAYAQQAPHAQEKWNSGLCDCCDDMGICCCGLFCMPCLECRVASDYGECCCLPLLPGTSFSIRTGIRERHHIEGTVCRDWVHLACCFSCALCQTARELKHRRRQANVVTYRG